jgi:hypothetical protein
MKVLGYRLYVGQVTYVQYIHVRMVQNKKKRLESESESESPPRMLCFCTTPPLCQRLDDVEEEKGLLVEHLRFGSERDVVIVEFEPLVLCKPDIPNRSGGAGGAYLIPDA